MDSSNWLWGVEVAGFVVVSYVWYAGMVKKRNKAQQALPGSDIHLRKRFDLVPNVLSIARRFMEHEKDLMTEITGLRSRAMVGYDKQDPVGVEKHLDAAAAIQPAMMSIFAAAENYPDLKSSELMLTAQHTYTGVEDHIAAARRTYNATVEKLNSSIQIFPGNLIASIASIRVLPFYKEETKAARPPASATKHLG